MYWRIFADKVWRCDSKHRMYVATVPNRGSPPAILLRESYREGGKVKMTAATWVISFLILVLWIALLAIVIAVNIY
jgi:hypothetical protein